MRLYTDVYLPEPQDENWEICWSAYCMSRDAALGVIRSLHKELQPIEQAANEQDGEFEEGEGQKLIDRAYRLQLVMQMTRQRLLALRIWLRYCKVIHGTYPRHKWEMYKLSVETGMPLAFIEMVAPPARA